MCCFSGTVEYVSGTQIFAHGLPKGRQVLVYSMTLASVSDVAMILPIPTPRGAKDNALKFVDLSGYPTFFEDLASLFPPPAAMGSLDLGLKGSAPPLVVQKVGAFDASFVPSPSDFVRLDARFRLPDAALAAMTSYADWGFAVFKLGARRTATPFHPMAFTFPRRDPSKLFFPTVHVHDGVVHPTANFAHWLYAQLRSAAPTGWAQVQTPAATRVDMARARGLVDGDVGIATVGLWGTRPNVDVVIDDR